MAILTKTIAMLLMMAPAVGLAQVNKCVDAAGKVVGYGSECPAGTRPEQTNIKSAPAAAGTQSKSTAEQDADFRKRQMEKQEATTKANAKSAEEAQRKRACDESRTYLKILQERQRVTRGTDPKTGERIYLNDADYPAEIARVERNVAANCK